MSTEIKYTLKDEDAGVNYLLRIEGTTHEDEQAEVDRVDVETIEWLGLGVPLRVQMVSDKISAEEINSKAKAMLEDDDYAMEKVRGLLEDEAERDMVRMRERLTA